MADATVTVTAEVEIQCRMAAVVRPGDKLVIALDHEPDEEEGSGIADFLCSRLPGVKVLVIGRAASLAVYPGEGDSAHA